jgi:hypothetical protein
MNIPQCLCFPVAADERRQAVERIKKEMGIYLVGKRFAAALEVFRLEPFYFRFLFVLVRIQGENMPGKRTKQASHYKLKKQQSGKAIDMLADGKRNKHINRIGRHCDQKRFQQVGGKRQRIHFAYVKHQQNAHKRTEKQVTVDEKDDMPYPFALTGNAGQFPRQVNDTRIDNECPCDETYDKEHFIRYDVVK